MFSKWHVKWIETLTWPQQGCDMKFKFQLRCYKTSTSFLASELSRGKSGFCKRTLEPSVLLSKTTCYLLVLVCEYLKSTHGFCPWLFSWPDYEGDYQDDGQQDGYENLDYLPSSALPVPLKMDPTVTLIIYSTACCIKTGSWDPYLCKTLCMVCNGWCTVISNLLCLAKMVILGLWCMA